MKKIFSILITFLLCNNTAFSQEINKTNSKGERTGVWKKYYDSGALRYEGEFKNGKEFGVFKFYPDSPTVNAAAPIITKEYSQETDVALTTFYTDKGVIESKGYFKGKERVGKWVYYHSDGKTIMIEENYEAGKLDGLYKVFYTDGGLTKISNYKNGLLNGNSKRYSNEGILLEDVYYVNGALNGPAIFYESDGQIKFQGNYDDDLKVGVWKFYQDGQLSKSKNIKVIDLEEEEIENQ